MARFKVICNCGWEIETNDKDTLNTACTTHDAACPLLFKPDTVELRDGHGNLIDVRPNPGTPEDSNG